MNADTSASEHLRARELIALGGPDGCKNEALEAGQQAWLQGHLQTCLACRNYAAALGQAVRALHADPLAADADLVQATRLRVRLRTAELARLRERAWLVGLSCLLVGLSSAITTPFVWHAFAWLGAWSGLSSAVWQTGFTFFWVVPAMVAGIALLGRGSHFPSTQ